MKKIQIHKVIFTVFFICDWLHYADSVTMDDFHII